MGRNRNEDRNKNRKEGIRNERLGGMEGRVKYDKHTLTS